MTDVGCIVCLVIVNNVSCLFVQALPASYRADLFSKCPSLSFGNNVLIEQHENCLIILSCPGRNEFWFVLSTLDPVVLLCIACLFICVCIVISPLMSNESHPTMTLRREYIDEFLFFSISLPLCWFLFVLWGHVLNLVTLLICW